MKTLHIIGSAELGGAERFFLRLVTALHEDGWDTAVVLRSNSVLARQLPAAVPKFSAGMRSPLSRWRVSKIIRTWQPAIVQTYLGRATELTWLDPSGPVVHLARLGGYYHLKRYCHAHAWVGNTRQLCAYLKAQGLAEERVFHIYNFIDPPSDPDKAEITNIQLPPASRVILFVGRLHPVKGLSDLLSAFAQLPSQIQDQTLYLVVVGDGPLRAELEHQAAALGIAERVRWAGWQDRLGAYYRTADIVVFPSLEEETLGNVILEAWVYGKPLLTSAHRGAQELCRHGHDAWCVPCNDAPALAEALQYLLANPELCATLAANGLRRVQRDFNRQTILRQYQALYQQLHRQRADRPSAAA